LDYCGKVLQFTESKLKRLKSHHCNRLCYLKARRKKQQTEYKKLRRNIKVSKSFQYWFAGFVDGEGTFSVKYDKNYNAGFVGFSVSQKEKKIINYIKSYLSFGNVNKTTGFLLRFGCNGYAKCKKIYDLIGDKVKTSNKKKQLKKWKRYFNYIRKDNLKLNIK